VPLKDRKDGRSAVEGGFVNTLDLFGRQVGATDRQGPQKA
jgi:hypothetical protein